MVCRDGTILTIDARSQRLSDGNAIVCLRDITEQRRTEQALQERDGQLRPSQRLESLGLMAGGLAHDFNNLLATVMGNAGLLQMTLSEDDESREVADEIMRAAAKGAELISQLLAFSRRQELKPRIVDVEAAVMDFIRMTRPIMGAGVEIAANVTDNSWPVNIDPVQLDQVLMNLVVNDRDALHDGGTVTIGVRNQAVENDETERLGTKPGEYVLLSVADTGSGMDAETMAHVFEPFYTTKSPEEGTGLGLSTVHGIVAQSGGHISVESEPRAGTVFTVMLPRAASQ